LINPYISNMPIRCVAFDLDGTLTYFTFPIEECKKELGMDGKGLLEFINNLPEAEKERAWSTLEKYEWQYAKKAIIMEGAKDLIDELKEKNIVVAVITRGAKDYAQFILSRYDIVVDIIVDRRDCEPKPSEESVLLVSKRFNIEPSSILVVGDTGYDIESGRRAGAKTALFSRSLDDTIANEIIIDKSGIIADHRIKKLGDVLQIIDRG